MSDLRTTLPLLGLSMNPTAVNRKRVKGRGEGGEMWGSVRMERKRVEGREGRRNGGGRCGEE